MPNETGFRQTNKLRLTYTTAKIESAGIFELIDFLKWILLLAQYVDIILVKKLTI